MLSIDSFIDSSFDYDAHTSSGCYEGENADKWVVSSEGVPSAVFGSCSVEGQVRHSPPRSLIIIIAKLFVLTRRFAPGLPAADD